ncbi:hypothetical protein PE066_02985 [Ramlibacter tataouinensis]|uniref:hypothetical protein n=1 Tax=Ramlibacter tataouinensis TaxID=94132 RepID=UPI0022F388E2|nr:hypothetical protein [Ramlibacter tataouinensis]WBY02516.1 hypothetical protein PE066_02985 [Ramlibacter tataouinensis]
MRPPARERPGRGEPASPAVRAGGVVLLLCIAAALLSAVAGGLLRAGVPLAGAGAPDWLGQAAVQHAALMICAFMGTVIAVERAVAVKLAIAWLAPAASALAGPLLLLGHPGAAGGLLVAAGAVFVGVNMVVVRRQNEPHTELLLASALAWLAGNLLFALGFAPAAVVPWWFAFLVMTIAAERLEMTRLMRRRRGALPALVALLALLVAGSTLSAAEPVAGGVLYGAALLGLALWLLAFDIARRTLFTHGLSRYMAVCLLGGYAWLAIGGLAWAATALGANWRDTALHALGLGFVFSMMMGHAPVILPAVARVKLLFGWPFYLPLALLHGSLLLRLGLRGLDAGWLPRGAGLNAAAIALFAATAAGAVVAWRRRHDRPRAG